AAVRGRGRAAPPDRGDLGAGGDVVGADTLGVTGTPPPTAGTDGRVTADAGRRVRGAHDGEQVGHRQVDGAGRVLLREGDAGALDRELVDARQCRPVRE